MENRLHDLPKPGQLCDPDLCTNYLLPPKTSILLEQERAKTLRAVGEEIETETNGLTDTELRIFIVRAISSLKQGRFPESK